MTNVDIYYFSGSGNSLYIAKELQERIPGSELIPIVSLLNRDIIETKSEIIGFVFPVHGMTMPVPVKKFAKKINVNSTKYLFAIATRAGTTHNAFTEIDKILEKKGKRLDSCFTLNMPSNDPKFQDWRPPTREEMTKLESEARKKVNIIQKTIVNKENRRERVLDGVIYPANFLIERLSLFGMFIVEQTGVNNYFYTDAKCIGCGTCEKVCPSQKIKVADKKPIWQKEIKCYFCYACVNYCPRKAVQIKSKIYMKSFTENKERYTHPYATANDIASQKHK